MVINEEESGKLLCLLDKASPHQLTNIIDLAARRIRTHIEKSKQS